MILIMVMMVMMMMMMMMIIVDYQLSGSLLLCAQLIDCYTVYSTYVQYGRSDSILRRH